MRTATKGVNPFRYFTKQARQILVIRLFLLMNIEGNHGAVPPGQHPVFKDTAAAGRASCEGGLNYIPCRTAMFQFKMLSQRKSDPELDDHISFLHTLPMYGISDHDLMFTKATGPVVETASSNELKEGKLTEIF